MKITIFANRITLGKGNPDPPPPPPRGDIHGFSKASRKRLLDKINSVRDLDDALFITLTYPDRFPRHPKVWKIHIANFRKRLTRQFPEMGGIWRLELIERKSGVNRGVTAPHFHLIVRGVSGSLKRIRHWAGAAWYEIVKSGDPKHAQAGTNVKLCENRNHAAWYVAKYIAKVDMNNYKDAQTGEALWTGRLWGSFGSLNCEPYRKGEISYSRYRLFRSVMARWLKEAGSDDYAKIIEGAEHGFTIYGFGAEGEKWKQLQSLLEFCELREETSNEDV
jgi:hypothetical protein